MAAPPARVARDASEDTAAPGGQDAPEEDAPTVRPAPDGATPPLPAVPVCTCAGLRHNPVYASSSTMLPVCHLHMCILTCTQPEVVLKGGVGCK